MRKWFGHEVPSRRQVRGRRLASGLFGPNSGPTRTRFKRPRIDVFDLGLVLFLFLVLAFAPVQARDPHHAPCNAVAQLKDRASTVRMLLDTAGTGARARAQFDNNPDRERDTPMEIDEYSDTFRAELLALLAEDWNATRLAEEVEATMAAAFDPAFGTQAICILLELEEPAVRLSILDLPVLDHAAVAETIRGLDLKDRGTKARLDLLGRIGKLAGLHASALRLEGLWIQEFLALENHLLPRGKRLSPYLLKKERDDRLEISAIALADGLPLVLMHRYQGTSTEALEAYAQRLMEPALKWFGELEADALFAVTEADIITKRARLLDLFESEIRRRLKLSPKPEMTDLQGEAEAAALLELYGRESVVDFILDKRSGQITVKRRGLSDYYGRPGANMVGPETIMRDAKLLGLSLADLSDALSLREVHRLMAAAQNEAFTAHIVKAKAQRYRRAGRSRRAAVERYLDRAAQRKERARSARARHARQAVRATRAARAREFHAARRAQRKREYKAALEANRRKNLKDARRSREEFELLMRLQGRR